MHKTLDDPKKTPSLKDRILVPLVLVLGLLMAAFIFTEFDDEKEQLAEDLQQNIQTIEETYHGLLTERTYKLDAALEVIATDTHIRQALVAHDRKKLFDLARPIFQKLKTRHNITQFDIHDSLRVNILRVHHPERYGDKIERFTTLNAERTKAISHGVELGPQGILSLRAVLPVLDGNKLIGYLELGEDINQFIQNLGRVFGVELIVVIDKQYLNQSDWQSGMAMLGQSSQWEQLSNVIIASQTPNAPINELKPVLLSLGTGGVLPARDINIIQNERHYRGRTLTLRDAGERVVGNMIVMRDITSRIQRSRKLLVAFSLSALLVCALLIFLFYAILDRTDRQLKTLISELRERRRLLSNAQRLSHIGSWEMLLKNHKLQCSSETMRILGSNTSNYPSNLGELLNLIHPADKHDFKNFIDSVHKNNRSDELIHRIIWSDGTERIVRHRAEAARNQAGEVYCINATLHDITTQQQAAARITLMGHIIEHSWNEIYVFDATTLKFTEVSIGACVNLGYSMEEMQHLTPLDLKPDFTQEQFEALLRPLRLGVEKQTCFEVEHQRKDGSRYWVDVRLQYTIDTSPPVFIAIIKDISEEKRFVQELEHKALYDTLTELPNRALMVDRLEHALNIAHRESSTLAVLMVDVMRLREINDILGHQSGDTVLKEVAHRLQKGLRKSDTVARLGGDEFVIILQGEDSHAAKLSAIKIHELLEESVIIGDASLEIELAIGIALYPDHGDTPAILLQHADIAMREAKLQSTGFAIYNPHDDPFSIKQLKLHGELRQAISNRTLAVYYQPKIDIKSGNITSAEALARWPHPTEGMISPDDFIPMVERSGLIRPFTLWVLEVAIKQSRLWTEAGIDISIAINLSTRNLLDPDLITSIERLLACHQVNPDRLILEITESAIMARPEQAMKVLTDLHKMGLKLSIDDFGTGYSSLSYLKKLPVAELKIDYSFVSRIIESESDAVIVRSTIDLAHNLGLKVVAEGVESKEILDLLAILRCDTAQGYYFSRPLPSNEFSLWLTDSGWGNTN